VQEGSWSGISYKRAGLYRSNGVSWYRLQNLAVVSDEVFALYDEGGAQDQIAMFECSTIAAATTRTFTFPNASGTLALEGWVSGAYVPYTGASSAVDLGAQNLTTTGLGTLGSLTVDNITIDAATILSDTGTISFGDENLKTTGTIWANQQGTAAIPAIRIGTDTGGNEPGIYSSSISLDDLSISSKNIQVARFHSTAIRLYKNTTITGTLTLDTQGDGNPEFVIGRSGQAQTLSFEREEDDHAYFHFFTDQGDGTKHCVSTYWGVGHTGDTTPGEGFQCGWVGGDPTGYCRVISAQSGAGVARYLTIFVSPHTDQLLFNTDGTCSFSGGVTLGDNVADAHVLNGSLTGIANGNITLQGTGTVTSGSGGFIVGNTTLLDGSLTDTDNDFTLSSAGTLLLTATTETNIGTGANYTTFETDGTLEFNGNATVWEDVNIDLSPLLTGGTKPGFSAPGTTGIRLLAFAVGEEVEGTLEIPHSYKLSSTITPHINWVNIGAPTGTDYVEWQLEYFIVDAEGIVGAASTIVTGDVAVDTDDERVDANFSTFSHATLGGQIGFKLSRIAADGDAYAGECGVLTFGFHYEIDTVGSRQITTK
jgi:hypothetical protein